MRQNISIATKLRKNKPAMVSLWIIILTCLLAVFAYPLAPDGTPNANNMTLELSARPMGYRQQFLLLPKQRMAENQAF